MFRNFLICFSKIFYLLWLFGSFVRLLVRLKIFRKIVRADAIDLVQKSSNFKPSLRFFGRLKIFNWDRYAETAASIGMQACTFRGWECGVQWSLASKFRSTSCARSRQVLGTHGQKHAKILKKLSPEPPKSSPGASKIEPGALQDAIFKRHLS